jgi:hypothetical protein
LQTEKYTLKCNVRDLESVFSNKLEESHLLVSVFSNKLEESHLLVSKQCDSGIKKDI